MTKTALIIEDHPMYRDALVVYMNFILGADNVVAAASTEEGLARAVTMNNLALVLLDLGLPGINGAEAVTSLRRKCPAASIVVVSASEDRREVDAVLRAGAKAFISKAVTTEVISEVVKKILDGAPLESTWITARGQKTFNDSSEVVLTPRQREALALLCQGLSNKEIGLRLSLAEITVKIHVSSIFRALAVVNRTQAVLAARRFGLYNPDQGEDSVAPSDTHSARNPSKQD